MITTGTNGLVSCITMTDIKSGIVEITEGTPVLVTFATASTNTPHCTTSVDLSGLGSATVGAAFFTNAPNTTNIVLDWRDSDSSHTENIMWVCTDTGNQ